MICDLMILVGFACIFAIGYAVGKRNAISDKVKYMLDDLVTTWKKTEDMK